MNLTTFTLAHTGGQNIVLGVGRKSGQLTIMLAAADGLGIPIVVFDSCAAAAMFSLVLVIIC